MSKPEDYGNVPMAAIDQVAVAVREIQDRYSCSFDQAARLLELSNQLAVGNDMAITLESIADAMSDITMSSKIPKPELH